VKIIDEFKEFAVRGNAIDLAVGIIIGAGFSKIVTSLVEDVILPPISLLTGDINFADKELVLRAATETTDAVTFGYGTFISTIVEFAIIAFAVFMIVRYINSLKREDPKEAKPKPRTCPFCKEGIAGDATRCAHCTATLKDV
jgi:large conductance mechanosensitive channel